MMACVECNHNTYYFDEVLGEKVCSSCGLIQMIRPFEETVKWKEDSSYEVTRDLGSHIIETPTKMSYRLKTQNVWSNPYTEADKRMFRLCNMILSYYNVSSDIRNSVKGYFISLKNEHILRGIPIEDRAAALTYFMLKEAGVPVVLKQHSVYSKVSKSKISKYAKRIARFFRKSHILSSHKPVLITIGILDKLDSVSPNYRSKSIRVVEHIEVFFNEVGKRYTTNLICATLWLVGQMEDEVHTQTELVDKSGNASTIGLRMATKDLSNSLGLTKKELMEMDVDQFLSGAY